MISRASSLAASRIGLDDCGYLSCWYNGTFVTLLSPRNESGTRGSVMLMYGTPSDVRVLVALFSCHTRL